MAGPTGQLKRSRPAAGSNPSVWDKASRHYTRFLLFTFFCLVPSQVYVQSIIASHFRINGLGLFFSPGIMRWRRYSKETIFTPILLGSAFLLFKPPMVPYQLDGVLKNPMHFPPNQVNICIPTSSLCLANKKGGSLITIRDVTLS